MADVARQGAQVEVVVNFGVRKWSLEYLEPGGRVLQQTSSFFTMFTHRNRIKLECFLQEIENLTHEDVHWWIFHWLQHSLRRFQRL